MNKYDCLKLDNQLCFPLYAASKEVTRKYKPFLDKLDLTYTQYIVMMILWEEKELNVKEIGERIYLDSGTLTPLLRKLESKGYIKRNKSSFDERNIIVSITKKGNDLKEKAIDIPNKIGKCVKLDEKEAKFMYDILYKILSNLKEEE